MNDAPAVLAGLLAARHSCRAFLPQAVDRTVIDSMLAIAQRTASWCNTQPWTPVVTSGDGTSRLRQVLQAAARQRAPCSDIPFPERYEGEHLARRRASGLQLYGALGIGRDDRAAAQAQSLRNYDFFDAPHVVLLFAPRALGPYALVDCGGWIANFLLAAAAHGIGAVPQAALARHSDVVRDHLGIDDTLAMVCGIAFGHADAAHPANGYRTAREPLDQAVRWVGR